MDDAEVPNWRHDVVQEYGDISRLLLAPKQSNGLTREDVAQMRAFLASLGG
ncbi:hypothetical protein LC082_06285 [Microbacterium esteraromaticum]|uniref:hypothetical protein n=1 Tax=Microbacterium esteraromaticum TaxID=57043 RepID=UPI001CD37FD1|nr:hypothetical protein [Microbacterium esteraromaticum]MCA1306503.1 hypothetical protein [Microbacterium esteraromaticum]